MRALGEVMQPLVKDRLVQAMLIGAVMALVLPGAARADLAVSGACQAVGLSDPVDRAAAAAALPTFSGVQQICTVQALLATTGDLPGSRTVDGRYDKQVRDALAQFQQTSGLDASGLLNPETVARLASDALDLIFADPPPTAADATPAPASSELPDTAPAEALADAGANDLSMMQVPAPRPEVPASLSGSSEDPFTGAATQADAGAPGIVISPTAATDDAATAAGVGTAVGGNDLTVSATPGSEVALSTDRSIVVTGSRLSASTPPTVTTTTTTSATSTPVTPTMASDRVVVLETGDEDADVNRVRVIVGTGGGNMQAVTATGDSGSAGGQTTVVTSTAVVETETYIVLADPLDDEKVSSFVRPSVCHDPKSVKDTDLIRNLDRLPALVCLRVFEGAGDLPYRFYSLEALQSGPTLMVLQDGDDLAYDTAIRLLANHGGRLVVFEADEQSRTTLTGASIELMTVSPYSTADCGWTAAELQLAYALHDYVVAVDVAVVSLRSGASGLAVLDNFSDGSRRLDMQSGGSAREVFQPVTSTLAPDAFLDLMVTAATRRSSETRAIVQGALINNLPTTLTQVNLLSDADRCGLEMLAQQTDQPVARLMLGVTSASRALDVGAAMIRAMRLAQQSAGLEQGLASDADFDRLRALETRDERGEAIAGISAGGTGDAASPDAPTPAGIDILAPVAVFGQDGETTTAMVVGEAQYVEEMLGGRALFPPSPKMRAVATARHILIPDGVDADFIHDWINNSAIRTEVIQTGVSLTQLTRTAIPSTSTEATTGAASIPLSTVRRVSDAAASLNASVY